MPERAQQVINIVRKRTKGYAAMLAESANNMLPIKCNVHAGVEDGALLKGIRAA